MKVFIAFALVLAAVPAFGAAKISRFYHENIGIPEARRIKEFEANLPTDTGNKIAGGSVVGLGEYPYVAGLLIALTVGGTSQLSVCTASLLSETKLVTAANCWWDGRNQGTSVVVVLGSVTLFSGGTRRNTTHVEMHANYDPLSVFYNIAAITVEPVTLSNVISPINLPTNFEGLTLAGNLAVVAGYGVSSRDESILPSQTLKHVDVMVITNEDCSSVYGFDPARDVMCTSGAGGVGPCAGDTGGPLVLSPRGLKVLIGVVSFHAASGCNVGFPGGYTRVTSHLSWLQQRLS